LQGQVVGVVVGGDFGDAERIGRVGLAVEKRDRDVCGAVGGSAEGVLAVSAAVFTRRTGANGDAVLADDSARSAVVGSQRETAFGIRDRAGARPLRALCRVG